MSQSKLDTIINGIILSTMAENKKAVVRTENITPKAKQAFKELMLSLVGGGADYDNDNPDDTSDFKQGYSQACDDVTATIIKRIGEL